MLLVSGHAASMRSSARRSVAASTWLPPSAISWLEEANFQMLRDHQCALVWVDACRHDKAFSKSWAFGCNSSKIRALEARCNHSYKHRSIAGVKEQGVYLSTLTAEYPPSLALQLAQVGIGRVSKTGSFQQKLPLHSDFSRPIALAPCRLPTCDGAGMHSSADWCCPKPEHQSAGPGCVGCMSDFGPHCDPQARKAMASSEILVQGCSKSSRR